LRQLKRPLSTLPAPPIAVTTLPIVADLMGLLPVRRWVYYCVDDFSAWPGLDQPALAQLEQVVVQKADVLITVSEALRTRLAQMGRQSHLLPHGVDLAYWTGTAGEGDVRQLEGLLRPLVVFWGVIDQRMDLEWLRRLAIAMPGGTIALIGPKDNPDPEVDRVPRVVCLPPLPFERLPQVAREAAVLVMPYADLPVTRAMQPLKLKEYLATGKPTVVRDLPSTREWADCLDLAAAPDEFAWKVCQRLQTGVPREHQAARARLAQEGWAEKARQMEQWMLEGA
jgi:glycosyltransferase involved in cell wall biosynthesis